MNLTGSLPRSLALAISASLVHYNPCCFALNLSTPKPSLLRALNAALPVQSFTSKKPQNNTLVFRKQPHHHDYVVLPSKIVRQAPKPNYVPLPTYPLTAKIPVTIREGKWKATRSDSAEQITTTLNEEVLNLQKTGLTLVLNIKTPGRTRYACRAAE